jgi:hypothetical protein
VVSVSGPRLLRETTSWPALIACPAIARASVRAPIIPNFMGALFRGLLEQMRPQEVIIAGILVDVRVGNP